jgi:hypothetical protein
MSEELEWSMKVANILLHSSTSQPQPGSSPPRITISSTSSIDSAASVSSTLSINSASKVAQTTAMATDQSPELFESIIVCNDGTMVSKKDDCGDGGVAPEDVKLKLVGSGRGRIGVKGPVVLREKGGKEERIVNQVKRVNEEVVGKDWKEGGTKGKVVKGKAGAEGKRFFGVVAKEGGGVKKREG